jgi:hypothetical protein
MKRAQQDKTPALGQAPLNFIAGASWGCSWATDPNGNTRSRPRESSESLAKTPHVGLKGHCLTHVVRSPSRL